MSRHKARQMAIEILFSREFHGKDDIQYQEEEILHSVNGTDEEHNPAVQDEEEYCNYLVTTTTEHMDEFDQYPVFGQRLGRLPDEPGGQECHASGTV